MKHLQSATLSFFFLLTTFVFFSCEEDFVQDNPFAGRWQTTITDKFGFPRFAIYEFNRYGRGRYTLYDNPQSSFPVEQEEFEYEFNGYQLFLNYFRSGSSDRFDYAFDDYNHFRVRYLNAYHQEVVEYYTRM